MNNDLSPIRPAAPESSDKVNAAKAAYIAVARQRYTKSTYDIEIDDAPVVGIAEDGAWVAAWLWVSQEDAGLCEEEAVLSSEA
ncbi:MAG: hypothetical protein ABSC48_13860 [Terracidiphilus sp.]|jgi:hypothetical protein